MRWGGLVGVLLLGPGSAWAQTAAPPTPSATALIPAKPTAVPAPPAPMEPDATLPDVIIQAPDFVLPDPLEQDRFLREEAEKWRFNNMETYLNPGKEDKYLRLPEMNTGTTRDQRYLGTQLHPCKLTTDHVLTCR
ncbi:hypothetical protein [Nitrospirillum sp. BR 11828]|uniref:hypothetical protein n=1 Tax=Nitrospirillum sp. BR 11828 TaxID=3104325 RepID=UPI002ACACAF0|nr:hypothetical protein [Nitrospirillum sp. BR 11828]MDZ5647914.1 hypothetical protein [Nitrospirillum sp. BR 11828]